MCICIFLSSLLLFLPPANEVCEGYVFTGVRLSTGGGHAWQGVGGVHGKGHAWLGVCTWWGRGMRGRGHVWQGVCMAGGACMAEGQPTGMHSCLENANTKYQHNYLFP